MATTSPAALFTSPMTTSPKKVLLIDDSVLSNEVTGLVLEQAGFEVRAAQNRAQFEDLLAEWWPDVAIIDVQMPDVDGAELCEFLKARIVVTTVLFSNLAPDELAERARRCGADAYLSKRTGYHELSQRVLELCQAATSVEPDAARRRILLFDDSELSLHFEAALLGLAGFEVRAATTLAEFDATLAAFAPDLILTDVNMPEIDGAALCQRLKASTASAAIPVVLFSAADTDELKRLAHEVGADAFLSKRRGYDKLGEQLRWLCDAILE